MYSMFFCQGSRLTLSCFIIIEIFLISKPSCSTLNVLNNAVYSFKGCVRIFVIEVIQKFVPVTF